MSEKSLKRYLIFLLVSMTALSAIAQQEVQYSQYMQNKLFFNPGFAGVTGSTCALGSYRNQWLGMKLDAPAADGITPGSTPQTYLFSLDLPVSFLHGGAGFTLYNDVVGHNKSVTVKLDYAYHLYWGPGNLSIGLEAQMFNNTLDYSKLGGGSSLTGDPNNPFDKSAPLDPLLTNKSAQSDFLFDLGVGLYYHVPGSFYLGLSSARLLESKSEVLNFQNKRHLFLTGGYDYVLPYNPSLKFQPSFLVKAASFSSMQMDVSCLAEFERTFWLGASYRIQDAFILMGGFYWKDFKLGLSYDMTTSRLGYLKSGRSMGTIEVVARYCFRIVKPPKPPTINRNTRYLE